MSRADMVAEVREIATGIAEKLDKAAAVSRADFGRQVSKIMKECLDDLARACA